MVCAGCLGLVLRADFHGATALPKGGPSCLVYVGVGRILVIDISFDVCRAVQRDILARIGLDFGVAIGKRVDA